MSIREEAPRAGGIARQHTSAYVSIRQHTSAYVSIREEQCDPLRVPVGHRALLSAEGESVFVFLY